MIKLIFPSVKWGLVKKEMSSCSIHCYKATKQSTTPNNSQANLTDTANPPPMKTNKTDFRIFAQVIIILKIIWQSLLFNFLSVCVCVVFVYFYENVLSCSISNVNSMLLIIVAIMNSIWYTQYSPHVCKVHISTISQVKLKTS